MSRGDIDEYLSSLPALASPAVRKGRGLPLVTTPPAPPVLVRIGAAPGSGRSSDWSYASSNSIRSTTRVERSALEALRNELSAARIEADRATLERDIFTAQMRRRENSELAPSLAQRRTSALTGRVWRLAARGAAQDIELSALNEDIVESLFLHKSLRRDLFAAKSAFSAAERRCAALEADAADTKEQLREAGAVGRSFAQERMRAQELAASLDEKDRALAVSKERLDRAGAMINDLQRRIDTLQRDDERPHGDAAARYEAQLRAMRQELERARASTDAVSGDDTSAWEERIAAAVGAAHEEARAEARDEARRAQLEEWEACEAEGALRARERNARADAARAARDAVLISRAAADVARAIVGAATVVADAARRERDGGVAASLRKELDALRAEAARERRAREVEVAAAAAKLAAARDVHPAAAQDAAPTPSEESANEAAAAVARAIEVQRQLHATQEELVGVRARLAHAVKTANTMRDAAARDAQQLRDVHADELRELRCRSETRRVEREAEQQTGYEAILDAAAVAAAKVLMDEMEARAATPPRSARAPLSTP